MGLWHVAHKFRAYPSAYANTSVTNIGINAVYFRNKYPDARIIAVEPDSENFRMLLRNTEHYDGIECLEAGIWNKKCKLRISDANVADRGGRGDIHEPR